MYRSGLESLKTMLPFYDSGSGTFYDLRHFTMKTSPKVKTTCRILIKLPVIPHRVKKDKEIRRMWSVISALAW
jgi:hypothetical protein